MRIEGKNAVKNGFFAEFETLYLQISRGLKMCNIADLQYFAPKIGRKVCVGGLFDADHADDDGESADVGDWEVERLVAFAVVGDEGDEVLAGGRFDAFDEEAL